MNEVVVDRPSRLLLAVAYATGVISVFAPLARSWYHYRQNPVLFCNPTHYIYWCLLFLPWLCGLVAIAITRTQRRPLGVVIALQIILFCDQYPRIADAVASVGKLTQSETPDDVSDGTEQGEPVEFYYEMDVTFGIPFYSLVVSSLWAWTVLLCFYAVPFGRWLWQLLIQIDAYLARDFREPPT